MTGAFASVMSFAACSILNVRRRRRVRRLHLDRGDPTTSASAMFSGKSMNAPPGFSVCATLNALRTTSGTISGSRTLRRVLGDRLKEARQVQDLVTLLVQPRRRALARDADDRRPVHVGVGKTGDQVGRTGPQGRHANARPARQPAVDVGHEGRALLMARRDELDRAVEQRIHDVDVLLARNAEDVFDALVLEASYEELRCFHGSSLGCRVVGIVAKIREGAATRAPPRRPAAGAGNARPFRPRSRAFPAG